MTTKSQETRAQIMGSAAAIGIASRACESYVRRLLDVNAEAMNFVSSRLRQDVELGESFARCKTWEDVSELQQAWGSRAVEDYMSMSQKIMELTSQMTDNPWASAPHGVGEVAPEKLVKDAARPVSTPPRATKPVSTPPRAAKPESTVKRARSAKAASTQKRTSTGAGAASTAKRTGKVKTAGTAKPASARSAKRRQKA